MPKDPAVLGKTGLVLSGGAGRVFFHVGALMVIGKMRLPFSYISAVSAGALAAEKFLETHPHVDALEKFAFVHFERPPFERRKISKLWGAPSFFDNAKLWEKVNQCFDFEKIAQSSAELHVITTDLTTGRERVFSNKNDEVDAFKKSIVASTALPGIFEPVSIYNSLYIDGGMVNPLPVSNAIRVGCETVIVIDSNPRKPRLTPENFEKERWWDVLMRGYGFSLDRLAQKELEEMERVNRELVACRWLLKWLEKAAAFSEGKEGLEKKGRFREKAQKLFKRLSYSLAKKRIRKIVIRPDEQLLKVSLRWSGEDAREMVQEGKRAAEAALKKAMLL